MKKRNYFFFTIIVLFIMFFSFLLYQSTPYYDDLSVESQDYIKELSENLTKGKDSDLEKIVTLNNFLYGEINQSIYNNRSDFYVSHSFESILERGWGLCFDRSYMLELMAQSLGFEVRHIAMTNGKSSHAVSEIKVDGKWVLFDSTYNLYYTNEEGVPMSLREVHEKRHELIKNYDSNTMNYIVYGINSFHGYYYDPRIPFPDMNVGQLMNNIYIIDLLPYTFKNLHYIYLPLIFLFLIGIILFINRKKICGFVNKKYKNKVDKSNVDKNNKKKK